MIQLVPQGCSVFGYANVLSGNVHTFTTLIVGVNVNLVAGSRPLFFGLAKLVWHSNAIVKCGDGTLRKSFGYTQFIQV